MNIYDDMRRSLADALAYECDAALKRSKACFGAFFDIELFVRTYIASLRATRCDGRETGLSIHFEANRLREFSLELVKVIKVVDAQFERRSYVQDVGGACAKLSRSLGETAGEHARKLGQAGRVIGRGRRANPSQNRSMTSACASVRFRSSTPHY